MDSRVVTALLRSVSARIGDISTQSTRAFLVQLDWLRKGMRLIEAVCEDVIQRGNSDQAVEEWRKKLKDVIREAEEVLKKYAYEVLLTKVQSYNPIGMVGSKLKPDPVSGSTPNFVTAAAIKLAGRLKQIRQNFEDIAEDWEALSSFQLNDENSDSTRKRQSFPIRNHSPQTAVFGRENEKEAIISLLLSADGAEGSSSSARSSEIKVLPILGLAGVGKSTIADLVYNDYRIRQQYDMLGWVYVPKDFNIGILTKSIVECFTRNSCNLTSVTILQEELSKIVRDRVFFLVLDNVQSEIRSLWEFFLAPLLFAKSGTIIVTTCSESVARITQTLPPFLLGCLSFNDSWSMFTNIAFEFNNINKQERLLAQSENIVTRCGGLPLTVKALASNLKFAIDEEEWLDMLEVKHKWFSNEVLGVLKNLYDHLPFKLKQCLQISTFYPRGFIFYKDDLVRLWMCGNLLEEENREHEAEGSLIFEELLQRSLIEPAHADHGDYGGYVMHDLLHDFAMLLTEYEFFLVVRNLVSDLLKFFNLGRFIKFETHPQILNLGYISICSGTEPENPAGARAQYLTCMTNLRQLSCFHLKHINIEMYFTNILGNLRYLDLKHFPLKSIPIEMMNFVGFSSVPQKIALLPKKKRISQFEANSSKSYYTLDELKGLVDPRGEVCITELSNVTSVKEAYLVQLQNKKSLDVLRMYWSTEPHQSSECAKHHHLADVHPMSKEQLFEILKPHYGLKELHIYEYCGSVFPRWLGYPSFTALTKISLSGGEKGPVLLPTLGQLPSLKNLTIRSMSGLCRVGREFCSVEVDKKGFRSLETLEIDDMVNWSEWTGVESGDFRCLNALKIMSCPELMSLPNPLSSLKTLVIKDCNTLMSIPNLPSLAFLILAGEVSESIFTCLDLPMLRALKVSQSRSIRCLPLNYEQLPLLEVLLISGCQNLQSVVGLSGLSSLQAVKILRCKNVKFSLRQKFPSTLLHLDISYCPKLQQWKEIQGSSYYEQIYNDTSEEVLQKLSNLEEAERRLMTTMKRI